MSVDETNVVDAAGIDRENHTLRLMITDHFAWEGEEVLSEYDHLLMLQEKINAYLSWLESGQYTEIYPEEEFKGADIEIRFLYEIPENCVKFLRSVQKQVGPHGITIIALCDDEEDDNDDLI